MTQPSGRITQLLHQLGSGDDGAMEELLPLVLDDLRRLAHRHMRGEGAGHTLQTTALVHEAYVRLASNERAEWSDRNAFLGVASMCMRRILVDHARQRKRLKRGGPQAVRLSLDDAPLLVSDDRADEVLSVDQALQSLAEIDARAARVVECRYFTGLSVEETAEVLGVGLRTVERDWQLARAWLQQQLTS